MLVEPATLTDFVILPCLWGFFTENDVHFSGDLKNGHGQNFRKIPNIFVELLITACLTRQR